MANLQVKNVPAALHRRIAAFARREGMTISDLVLEAVRRELARAEWKARLARRSSVVLPRTPADLLEEERAARDGELGP